MNKEVIDYFDGDELAANVWEKKYKADGEKLPSDSYARCAKEFIRVNDKYGDSNFKALRLDLEWLIDALENDKICLAGSVLANLGNKDYIGSLSNCFVGGQPHDSYSGILEKDELLVQFMKRRGGVGLDISTLRPKNHKVNNAAKTSTGAVSFANRYSNTTNEVAQNGRRGALMLSMEMRHPDILDFITAKQDLTKLTGANMSVGIRDDFMEAVIKDEEYTLRWPCNHQFKLSDYRPSVSKVVKAKEIWNTLIECAWKTGEPGIIFLDHHWDNSPDSVYPQYKGITTNPCGEIFMSEYETCRLIHINVMAFVDNPFTANATFRDADFYDYCWNLMMLADDLIDLEIEAVDKIIDHIASNYESVNSRELSFWRNVKEKALNGRRAGCGSLGWADAVAALGMDYDSDEALEFIETVAAIKYEAELESSIYMASTRGAFPDYDPEIDPTIRRNISWSTVAPTGTTAILAGVSSGIEPLFATHYTRNVKVEDNGAYDFIDKLGIKWKQYPVYHRQVKAWMEANPDAPFEANPWNGCTADKINWKKRIQIQAIIQKFTTHSISSTINLPKGTTKELVNEIYIEAWKSNLKGITVYVDGSRSGVLVTDNSNNSSSENSSSSAPKRPKSLESHFYPITVKGHKFGVIVGMLDNKPYEIFCMPDPIRLKECTGTITKVGKGQYNFKSDTIEIRNLHISGELERSITILTSQLLRHGVPLKYIIATVSKVGYSITDFSSAIKRVLSKYIVDGEASGIKCPSCGDELIFENGCKICKSCGYSGCN